MPLFLEYPFKKDMTETKPKRIFSPKTVKSYKVEQTSLGYSGAFKDDDVFTDVTFFFYCWHILLEHWPMFLNIRQA